MRFSQCARHSARQLSSTTGCADRLDTHGQSAAGPVPSRCLRNRRRAQEVFGRSRAGTRSQHDRLERRVDSTAVVFVPVVAGFYLHERAYTYFVLVLTAPFGATASIRIVYVTL